MKKIAAFSTFLVFAVLIFFGCNITVQNNGTDKSPADNSPYTETPQVGDTVTEESAATTPPADICLVDGDCVPEPECHPHECMLKGEADKLEKPQVCTMMYDYQAAYSAEDCACTEGACVNKNLGRKAGI